MVQAIVAESERGPNKGRGDGASIARGAFPRVLDSGKKRKVPDMADAKILAEAALTASDRFVVPVAANLATLSQGDEHAILEAHGLLNSESIRRRAERTSAVAVARVAFEVMALVLDQTAPLGPVRSFSEAPAELRERLDAAMHDIQEWLRQHPEGA
jgi:hypothetical protein